MRQKNCFGLTSPKIANQEQTTVGSKEIYLRTVLETSSPMLRGAGSKNRVKKQFQPQNDFTILSFANCMKRMVWIIWTFIQLQKNLQNFEDMWFHLGI